MLFLIWTVVLFATLYLYLRRVYTKFSASGVKNLPTIPLLGNLLPILLRRRHLAEDMDFYYNQFPDERFVGRFEFVNPIVMVRDLDLIKRITIKDFEYFLDHRGFTDEKVEPLFGRNLFSLKGDEWKDMRSTLSPAFTSSKIRLMVPFMEEAGNQMIAALMKKTAETGGPIQVECKDLTSRYANDVIASCAFGLKVDSHLDANNTFYEQGKTASSFKMRQLLMFFAYSAFPSIVKRLKLTLFSKDTTNFFISLVLDTMKNREENNIIRPDMIHLLMEAKKGQLNHDEKTKDKVGDTGFATVEESAVGKKTSQREWSDTDLIAQAVLFFIAGFETISVGMSFALHELALHPEVQERLAQEIKDTHERSKGKLDFNLIQNMQYMDMVVSEVLRLWPPGISLDRLCCKDYNMGKPNKYENRDFILRKGDLVAIPVFSIHRDAKYFPDPEKFDPERFSDENKHLIKSMTYMPFGVGPRNCIGSRFALLELKMLIYQIILHMEVSPCEKTCIPSKLSVESVNLRLVGDHWLNFKIRQ
ncbi:cytochrome P450 9e2-like isoform X5 [Leptidea sinapis]|uniref:cytochrome P450 9e2-like isoform X5 n=1 Tax=Leptidea sinapis TaxID=189913 RepID=UPI0021C30121|nr:cytochrome P450 9e2-like isoform X5 [Leptidea sinapis]